LAFDDTKQFATVDQAAGHLQLEVRPFKCCLTYLCRWIRLLWIRPDKCTWSRLQCCCSWQSHHNLRCL